jgi:hypothetical protein
MDDNEQEQIERMEALDGDSASQYSEPAPFTRNQKLAVGALGVFAVLVFGFWLVDLSHSINGPLNSRANIGSGSESQESGEQAGLAGDSQGACPDGQCAGGSEAELRAIDTDGDGLSDWDEPENYGTSPYLEDTDSDGFSDAEEIESGNDPNCPDGESCSSAGFGQPSGSAAIGQEAGSQEGIQAGAVPDVDVQDVDQDSLEALMGGNTDADTLRQVLVEAGVDKAVLDQFTDEQLMQSYQDVLGQ